MSHYCHRCGSFALLDAVIRWCGRCTEQWARDYAAKGDPR